jgi:predicted RNA-binding protein with PUA-like domain
MNYWLVKSEPDVYSWEQFIREGKTCWSGVKNYAARLHLNAMQLGDPVMYYHSNKGLEVVGIARVIKTAYPDPTTNDERWVAVDLEPFIQLKKPVPLSDIKKEPVLKNIALVRIGRLSVMPLTKPEYNTLLKMSGTTIK